MYNHIFRTTIMGESHVWIGSSKIAQELLAQNAPIYSSRPQVPAVPGSDVLPHYLPLMAYGDAWHRHRRFVTTVLSSAHNANYHGYINFEAKRFLFTLLESPDAYYDLINEFTGRVSARMNYGSPDSAAAHVRNAFEFIPQISPSGPVTNRLPFLIQLPEWLNTSKRFVRERREREAELWHGLVAKAKQDYESGISQPPSSTRLYFERKEAAQSTQGKAFDFDADDKEFAYAVGMLTTVAIFTIGAPLNAFFLSMVLHPEWQARVRAELDAVVGSKLVASRSDLPRLPVLRAVLKETLRWRPAVPFGVPRLVEEDNIYNGRLIKKGTIAHVVELAIARDPVLYPDPDAFNPDRWLKPSYPTYREPLTEHPSIHGHHQFGFGRRVCPGVALTEAELLAACSGILSCFELKKKVVDGKEHTPDPWKMSTNLIGGPLEFEFNLEARCGARERVEKLWRAAEAEGV